MASCRKSWLKIAIFSTKINSYLKILSKWCFLKLFFWQFYPFNRQIMIYIDQEIHKMIQIKQKKKNLGLFYVHLVNFSAMIWEFSYSLGIYKHDGHIVHYQFWHHCFSNSLFSLEWKRQAWNIFYHGLQALRRYLRSSRKQLHYYGRRWCIKNNS